MGEKEFSEISRKRFNKFINETVEELLKRAFGESTEMAVPLKSYKTRVDALRFQLVENWCLCKWYQLFNPESENFMHCVNELKACIYNLKILDIKGGIDKDKTVTRMLVNDYDYNKSDMIERIIRSKFTRENILNDSQKMCVCDEFADNIESLIAVISDNSEDVDKYIYNTFAYLT